MMLMGPDKNSQKPNKRKEETGSRQTPKNTQDKEKKKEKKNRIVNIQEYVRQHIQKKQQNPPKDIQALMHSTTTTVADIDFKNLPSTPQLVEEILTHYGLSQSELARNVLENKTSEARTKGTLTNILYGYLAQKDKDGFHRTAQTRSSINRLVGKTLREEGEPLFSITHADRQDYVGILIFNETEEFEFAYVNQNYELSTCKVIDAISCQNITPDKARDVLTKANNQLKNKIKSLDKLDPQAAWWYRSFSDMKERISTIYNYVIGNIKEGHKGFMNPPVEKTCYFLAKMDERQETMLPFRTNRPTHKEKTLCAWITASFPQYTFTDVRAIPFHYPHAYDLFEDAPVVTLLNDVFPESHDRE